jgi:Ca2+-binding EF-hand superfamily protein
MALNKASSPATLGTGGSSSAGSETGRQMPRAGTEHLNLENLREVIMDNGEKLKTLFEMWDEDASGTTSAKEFRSALKTLGFRASDAHMNALFDKLDKDKSGQLDYKEMLKAIEGSRKSDKAKIALERKLLEEKRAREAAEARAAALSAQFAAARA